MKTLREVRPGERAVVRKIMGESALRHRIMNMGVTKGTSIEVIKVAPFGDPMEITLRGYHLSLRKTEADTIEVELRH